MGSTHLRTVWSTLVQALVDSEGRGVRARILLEGLAREPWIQACAIWRQEPQPNGWACVLSRGAPDELPGEAFVEEVAAGRTPADLLSGRGVLLSGRGLGALALTYAGTPDSEEELDLISGLLHVVRLTDAAESSNEASPLEDYVPALPHSAPGRRSKPRESASCSPAELLAQLREEEASICERLQIRFEVECDEAALALRCPLSASELARAVRNLVLNAREALESSSPERRIRLHLRSPSLGQVSLTIEDTALGLPAEILKALNSDEPKDLPGPGLGLAVAWGIALSAGGHLRVAESSERGTKFEITLPAARAS
ncbi:MAG: sensor histidine kinase [Planctomycetes bacterium]|nr:sensor histidine kinase [Planctomycetota bacterium]